MRMSLAIPAALILVACSTEPPAAWQMGDPAVGHQVARDLCADCHAIERTGDLHESRVIGFRKMPVFHFGEGHEYDLVAYLLSIQETRASQPTLGPPR
jgi:hypothetical protein